MTKVYPEAVNQPHFTELIQKFLYKQQHPDDPTNPAKRVYPTFYEQLTVYPSALATFYTPSNLSRICGMKRKCIHTVKTWRKGPGRYNTVFVVTDSTVSAGMAGLDVAWVQLFFSFTVDGIQYPCALIHWFTWIGDRPDKATGMWIVKPDNVLYGAPSAAVIHLDMILRAAHLLPVFGEHSVSKQLTHEQTLDKFTSFYVNKYADHHAFAIAF